MQVTPIPKAMSSRRALPVPSKLLTGIGCTGTLGCDPTNRTAGDLLTTAQVTYTKESDQGKWGITRGNNKDLLPLCQVVPYTFEVNVLSNPQTSKFIVPDPLITGQKVAAKYTVVWGRFNANPALDNMFQPVKRVKVSWGIVDPVVNTDDFVPALPCVLDPDNPDLTGPGNTYPNGFVSVPTGDLDKLLPVIPPVAPFTTFTATNRPQYMVGNKAKMCVTQQGWTATGTDSLVGPLDVTPTYPITSSSGRRSSTRPTGGRPSISKE